MPVEFIEMIPNSTRQAYNVISVNFLQISMDLHPIRPVELGVNPLRLHCLLKALDYIVCLVKVGGHNLNGFIPNLTSRI